MRLFLLICLVLVPLQGCYSLAATPPDESQVVLRESDMFGGNGKKAVVLGILTTGGMITYIEAFEPQEYDYTSCSLIGGCHRVYKDRFSPGGAFLASMGTGMFVGGLYYLLMPESEGNKSQALLTVGKGLRRWKMPAVTLQKGQWRVPLARWLLPGPSIRTRSGSKPIPKQ